MRTKGKLTHVNDIVKSVIYRLSEKKYNFTQEQIYDIWHKVVGEEAFKHSRPVSFKKAVLIVDVDSNAWIFQLRFRKNYIDKKLNEFFKEKIEVRLRIGRV